jgi:hypothetical protein
MHGRGELQIFTGPTARRDALRYAMQSYMHFKEVQLEPNPARYSPCPRPNQGSPPIHRDVRARSRRDLKIAPQDRRSSARINFLQAHRFTVAVTENRPSTGRPHVGYPIRALTEHCHEIAFALVVRHDEWE